MTSKTLASRPDDLRKQILGEDFPWPRQVKVSHDQGRRWILAGQPAILLRALAHMRGRGLKVIARTYDIERLEAAKVVGDCQSRWMTVEVR